MLLRSLLSSKTWGFDEVKLLDKDGSEVKSKDVTR
jgi:hypothetical protein